MSRLGDNNREAPLKLTFLPSKASTGAYLFYLGFSLYNSLNYALVCVLMI
jgi:hypothetical protein